MCVWSPYFLQYLAWSEVWKAFQRLEVVMGIPLSLEDMEAFVLLLLFLHGRLKHPAWATCHENGGLEPPYLEIRGHKVVELDWSSIPSTNYRKNLRADGTSQCKVVRWMLFVPWLLGQIQSLGLSQCLFWGLKSFTGSLFYCYLQQNKQIKNPRKIQLFLNWGFLMCIIVPVYLKAKFCS